MGLNLKRILACITLTMLTALSAHTQTLCAIDGTPLLDSLLHVTTDGVRSDSVEEIVAKRLGLTPFYAIEFIQTFVAEEQIKQGKDIIFCKLPKDAIIIQTDSLTELQWVISGKLRKPREKLTIIDYKLSSQRIAEALPEGIKPTGMGSVNTITHVNNPRVEKYPTIMIETRHKSVSKR